MQSVDTAIIVPFVKDKTLAATLQALAKNYNFTPAYLQSAFGADSKEVLMLPIENGDRTLWLLGLGERVVPADVQVAFRIFSYQQRKRLSANITLDIAAGNIATKQVPNVTESAVAGLFAGAYDLGVHKTGDRTPHPLASADATVNTKNQAAAVRGRQMATVLAEICALVDAPSNFKTPVHLANWAAKAGITYGFEAQSTIGTPDLTAKGMHALLAVAKGSDQDAAFIELHYKPKKHEGKLPCIALVGKGVTFDTGGVSIKPANNMHMMKSDMGGAAAVFGTIALAALQQWPVEIHGIVPATENSIGSAATKPSEVFSSYSGKTIEMIDTDAEGRLILADGLSWAVRNCKPDVVIDLATLTGSIIRTFGYHCAGMFTPNDDLARAVEVAGQASGELVWRLPLFDVYDEDIQSDVADLRNLSGKPVAGAISAAKFLEVFTEGHTAWVHLDIAGTAYQNMEYAPYGRAATGYGVRLLAELLNNHLKNILK